MIKNCLICFCRNEITLLTLNVETDHLTKVVIITIFLFPNQCIDLIIEMVLLSTQTHVKCMDKKIIAIIYIQKVSYHNLSVGSAVAQW